MWPKLCVHWSTVTKHRRLTVDAARQRGARGGASARFKALRDMGADGFEIEFRWAEPGAPASIERRIFIDRDGWRVLHVTVCQTEASVVAEKARDRDVFDYVFAMAFEAKARSVDGTGDIAMQIMPWASERGAGKTIFRQLDNANASYIWYDAKNRNGRPSY